MKTKHIPVGKGIEYNISRFPNFHQTGSIKGMKAKYYGKNALLVKCGNYIYNVSSEPLIYEKAF